MKNFKINTTYQMRSACDHNCIWTAKVIKRTAKFVTLEVSGEKELVRCGVFVYENVECCKPLGSYSMCPILRADKN